jgi:hypothetical protein
VAQAQASHVQPDLQRFPVSRRPGFCIHAQRSAHAWLVTRHRPTASLNPHVGAGAAGYLMWSRASGYA